MTSVKPAARCQERVKERIELTPPTSPRAASRLVTEDLMGRKMPESVKQVLSHTIEPNLFPPQVAHTFCVGHSTFPRRPSEGSTRDSCSVRRKCVGRRPSRGCRCGLESHRAHIGPMSRDCLVGGTWREKGESAGWMLGRGRRLGCQRNESVTGGPRVYMCIYIPRYQ